jgi:universal stress protein E
MSDTILTIIELENYPEQVVERATWLAKLTNSNLELLLCDPTSSFVREEFIVSSEVRELVNELYEAEGDALARLAEVPKAEGIEVITQISHDRPIDHVIVDRASELGPRFVVKGTHYHTPAERATFSDTDWQLMKRLDFALWFVKPVEWKEKPLIVAAVDPVHQKDEEALLDARIVSMAQSLADACDGHVALLHTYQRLVEIGSRATWAIKPVKLPIEKLDQKLRDEHREKLDSFARECGIAADAVHQLPGRAHELLPSFAQSHGASLIVMGALSRSGLKKRYIGNTAARVLDHLPCDVMVIPPQN